MSIDSMCWFGGFIRFLSSRTTEQKKVHSDADTRPFAYSRELSYTSIKLGAYAPVRDAMEPLNEYIGLVQVNPADVPGYFSRSSTCRYGSSTSKV